MIPRVGSRRLLIVLVAVVLALSGSAALAGGIGPLQQPSGDEVLDRVEQRYDAAETLTTTAAVTVENDSTSVNATVAVATAAEDRGRTVVTQNGSTYRVGSNGTVVWAVGPNRSAAWPVERLEDGTAGSPTLGAEPVGPTEYDLSRPHEGTSTTNESNVSVTLVGTPSVDGTDTYQVELTPPAGDETVSLWVAQDDYRVLRVIASDGTNRTTVSVESTAFNVSIHDSTFDPPTDRVALSTFDRYEEFEDAQAATDLTLPRLGDAFAGATVTVRRGETIVGQRYVRDGGNVSVVSTTETDRFDRLLENESTRTIDGRTVVVTTADERAVAAWSEDGVTTAVVVDGPTDRAVEIASDLSP